MCIHPNAIVSLFSYAVQLVVVDAFIATICNPPTFLLATDYLRLSLLLLPGRNYKPYQLEIVSDCLARLECANCLLTMIVAENRNCAMAAGAMENHCIENTGIISLRCLKQPQDTAKAHLATVAPHHTLPLRC